MKGISGFKHKRELRAAVGEQPLFIETSVFGKEYPGDGKYTVVGPSPQVRKWYATITVIDGVIAKVV